MIHHTWTDFFLIIATMFILLGWFRAWRYSKEGGPIGDGGFLLMFLITLAFYGIWGGIFWW
jgi:hypothetical protein